MRGRSKAIALTGTMLDARYLMLDSHECIESKIQNHPVDNLSVDRFWIYNIRAMMTFKDIYNILGG
jgi:hypothetical protein